MQELAPKWCTRRRVAELCSAPPGQRPGPTQQTMTNVQEKNDLEKEAAARASLQFIQDGQVVGLGTGSTAACFIKLLGEEVKRGLRIRGIPTSLRSQELARSLGIPLTTLDECQEIAVTVDGADEVDPRLRLIKGGGGGRCGEKF